MEKEKIEQLLSHLQTMSIGFVAINNYTNQKDEVSCRRINVGYSYDKLKKDDLSTLVNGIEYIPSGDCSYSKTDWDAAVIELKNSIIKADENRSIGQVNAYMRMTDNGAISYNYEKQELYIQGLELKGSKKIIEHAEQKIVKSSPKTLAKNVIRQTYLKSGKIRKFIVREIGQIKLCGETIEFC